MSSQIRHKFQRTAFREALKKVSQGEDADKIINEFDISNIYFMRCLKGRGNKVFQGKFSSGSVSAENQKKLCQEKITPWLGSISEPLMNYLNRNGVSASILLRSLSAETKLTGGILYLIELYACEETKAKVLDFLNGERAKNRTEYAISLLNRNKIKSKERRCDVLQCVLTHLNGSENPSHFEKEITLLEELLQHPFINSKEVHNRLNRKTST